MLKNVVNSWKEPHQEERSLVTHFHKKFIKVKSLMQGKWNCSYHIIQQLDAFKGDAKCPLFYSQGHTRSQSSHLESLDPRAPDCRLSNIVTINRLVQTVQFRDQPFQAAQL